MPNRKKTDDNEDKEFPGYPHYPSEDDITNPANGNRKVEADVERLANSARLSSLAANEQRDALAEDAAENETDDDIRIVPGTEADVTEEDLILLGDKDADQDMSDDELMEGNARVDYVESEDDLDVPGADEDKRQDAMDQGDEENDFYSIGGDRHEDFDEDPAGGNQDQ